MLKAPLVLCLVFVLAFPARAQEKEEESESNWLVPSLHSATVVFGARVSLSVLWPDAYDVCPAGRNWENFKSAWSSGAEWDNREGFFEWDHDPWAINLVGHGFMGSEFYLRHRQHRHEWWVSLGMTLVWTFAWEYLLESWHKQPSGIDMLWTPVGGALIGEGRYWLYREVLGMEEGSLRHVLLYLIDPIGQAERDLFGLDR